MVAGTRSRRELADNASDTESDPSGGGQNPPPPQEGDQGARTEEASASHSEHEIVFEYPKTQEDPVPFALVPAQANTDIIDYRKTEGIKLFQSATQGLYKEASERFDCDSEELISFIQLVEAHSKMLGYHNIYQIPTTNRNSRDQGTRDFIEHYGIISLGQVRAHASTYVNTHTRLAQESTQLFYCLWNSLSSAGRAKISIWDNDYTVNGQLAGVPMLKVIIRESDVDTQATTAYIRRQLASLDTYMKTIDSDINKFNLHVRSLIRQLEKRRQTSQDLLTNLFKGYKAASDHRFVEYIERKEEEYEEGDDIYPDELMILAATKYKIRTRNGDWNAPTPEEAKILALEAKIQSMTKKEKKNSKDTGKDNKKTEKDRKNKGNHNKKDKPAWMTKPPTENEKGKSKKVDGKEYWWCEALKCWARHHPTDCRAKEKGPHNPETTAKTPPTANNKKVKFANALSAVSDDE